MKKEVRYKLHELRKRYYFYDLDKKVIDYPDYIPLIERNCYERPMNSHHASNPYTADFDKEGEKKPIFSECGKYQIINYFIASKEKGYPGCYLSLRRKVQTKKAKNCHLCQGTNGNLTYVIKFGEWQLNPDIPLIFEDYCCKDCSFNYFKI